MRRSILTLLLVLFALVALPACDDEPDQIETPTDTTGDTGGDTSTDPDTTGGDTTGGDTALDTSGGDTGGGDTGGGDTTVPDTADVATDTTVDTALPDTTDPDTSTDAASDATDTVTPPTCDHQGFVAVAQDAGEFQGVFFYVAQDSAGAPVSTLNFELVAASGGATTAGTYTITDDDYSTCGNCVVLYQNCDEGLANCEKTFLATSGTLDITLFGQPGELFAGTLSDAVLVEVTIADDFTSTPVEGGETWCVDDYLFSAVVQE